MRIPHTDPDLDPPDPFVYPLDYPKQPNLTFDDFHPPAIEPQPQQQPPTNEPATPPPHWLLVSTKLHTLHTRFALHNHTSTHPHLSPPSRRLVLLLYREALSKLEHTSPLVATKIHLEVIKKVTTVLGLRVAAPTDSVFYTQDAYLRVLEPQYAEPRVEFFDRGDGGDAYFWVGYGRLCAWRGEGWPGRVPVGAIEREEREREGRTGKGKGMVREGLQRAMGEGIDWGEEVDADPGRPWA